MITIDKKYKSHINELREVKLAFDKVMDAQYELLRDEMGLEPGGEKEETLWDHIFNDINSGVKYK
jgi:hypothetical protein